MATVSTVLPLCLILLFFQASLAQLPFGSPWQSSRGFRGDQASPNQCQFERLTAREPTRLMRMEAGSFEHYSTDPNDELSCAGIDMSRFVIESKGLLLPNYANGHKLIYIAQGRGIFGALLPGCPATFQSTWSPSSQRQMPRAGESQSSQKFRDEHQQIQQFRQGDVIAKPAGLALWLHNNGDSPVVLVAITDTTNNANQLNPAARKFLLAGQTRRPEQQQYSYEAEKISGQNIFAGFNQDLLAEALGVSRQLASRLQAQDDPRGFIVQVAHGLQALQPSFPGEPVPLQQQEGYGEYMTAEQTTSPGAAAYGQQNGIEETMCSLKFRRNVDNPQSSDIYNPRGGRITRANSQNFPILGIVQMSATRNVLLNNAVLAPHWTVNAHTVMYVTAGRGRVQVVNNRGRSVFDSVLRQAQILLIPQNFVVAVKARQEGFAWVSFKTNANCIDSHIAGKQSVLRALPVDVLANAYRLSREESRSLKFNRGDETAVFEPRHGRQQAYAGLGLGRADQ
ncbi:hypothetical protein ACP70R_022055 [Stipagrostis hirtigluma subsp. patula]